MRRYVAMENLAAPLTVGHARRLHERVRRCARRVRLWNVLRTPGALQAGMVAELVGNETGLAAYWRLNEGIGWSAGDDSPGTATAALLNGTQWAADGPLAPDTTAPQITNVAVTDLDALHRDNHVPRPASRPPAGFRTSQARPVPAPTSTAPAPARLTRSP